METQNLEHLFESWAKQKPEIITPLPRSGSARRYFRLVKAEQSAIGTFNPNKKENEAFIHFTEHFHKAGIPVPKILAKDLKNHSYLQEDLGDNTLMHFLMAQPEATRFNQNTVKIYKKVIDILIRIQLEGINGFDFSKCYPKSSFDKQQMLWDLNYFKFYFLKLLNIPFNETKLEEDYLNLCEFLSNAKSDFFLYRDFQSRNVMLKNGEPYCIDYQGGMKGPLQYDLVSLLFQARANMPNLIRKELLDYYISQAEKKTDINKTSFKQLYYGFVLLRSLQVLAAYGLRGLYEKKEHFKKSIPYAINNVKWWLNAIEIPVKLPHLRTVLHEIVAKDKFKPYTKKEKNKNLTVRISSFSYKISGIPQDPSGNGGGFVFDCRNIHNPGRYEPYKKQTGRDQPVIDFLKNQSYVEEFLLYIFQIIDPAVENYLNRGFSHLMISFGCTGGQHRSVYCADRMASHLEEKYGVTIQLEHIEQEKKKWKN